MNPPKVTAVMLVNGRPKMVRRAIDAFLKQTYENRRLYIYDTSIDSLPIIQALPEFFAHQKIVHHHAITNQGDRPPIGLLRNCANSWAVNDGAEVIVHWDSDDWSGPTRIEDQVAFLIESRVDLVGYFDMLFWRSKLLKAAGDMSAAAIESGAGAEVFQDAWYYKSRNRRYCLGTSFCYWAAAWQRRPFDGRLPERKGGRGEDYEFMMAHTFDAQSSFKDFVDDGHCVQMVAGIHNGNTQDYSDSFLQAAQEFSRVPEFDSLCRRIMGDL